MMFVLKASALFLGLVAFCFGSFFSPRDEESCPQEGLTCSAGCSSMMYCAEEDGNGTVLQNCTESESFCETVDGIPSCTGISCPTILCGEGTSGSIPSPFDCSRYFFCDVPGNATDQSSCPSSNPTYNSLTQNCTQDQCTREPVTCETPGAMGSLDNYRYVCLGPDHFLIFKSNDSSPPTQEPPTCTRLNQKFQDPADCHSYFICLGQAPNFVLTHRTCPNGTHYDPVKLSCLKGSTC